MPTITYEHIESLSFKDREKIANVPEGFYPEEFLKSRSAEALLEKHAVAACHMIGEDPNAQEEQHPLTILMGQQPLTSAQKAVTMLGNAIAVLEQFLTPEEAIELFMAIRQNKHEVFKYRIENEDRYKKIMESQNANVSGMGQGRPRPGSAGVVQ